MMRAIVLVSVIAGCTTVQRPGMCGPLELADPQPGDTAAAVARAEKAWANRTDPASLHIAIDAFREALATRPADPELMLKLSWAVYQAADGARRFAGDLQGMSDGFEEATQLAEEALRLGNPTFARRACGRRFDEAVAALTRRDLPAVYLYLSSLGRYGLANSVVVVLEHQRRFGKLIKRMYELDPDFNHGAAEFLLGAYYSKVPFPSGNLEKSRRWFERALKRSPRFLATRVLMAALLATRQGDRALFEGLLTSVIEAPDDALPGWAPEHRIEKAKAAALLANADTLFPPVGSAAAAPGAPGWFHEEPKLDGLSGAIDGHSLRLIRTGEQMDDERWKLVSKAKRSLYIAAFAWHNDNVGVALIDHVCKRIRASRGRLEVKIIVEHFGSKSLLTGEREGLVPEHALFADKDLPTGAEVLRKCGARIVFFRPRREEIRYALYVRHEKLFLADGKHLLIGGSNIGDHYHMSAPDSGKWHDIDVAIDGPIACWYHNEFQRSWRSVVSQDIGIELRGLSGSLRPGGAAKKSRDRYYGMQRMTPCDVEAAPAAGGSRVYAAYGKPIRQDQRPILDTYVRALGEAQGSAMLYAPYFVPLDEFSQALVDAVKRGVKVQLIMNSPKSLDEDHAIYSAALLSFFRELPDGGTLFSGGVELYQWDRKATFHRKGGIIDDRLAYLGSDNLDVRGQELSSESIAWTDDPIVVSELAWEFRRDLGRSERVTQEIHDRWIAEQRASLGGRLKLWAVMVFRNLF